MEESATPLLPRAAAPDAIRPRSWRRAAFGVPLALVLVVGAVRMSRGGDAVASSSSALGATTVYDDDVQIYVAPNSAREHDDSDDDDFVIKKARAWTGRGSPASPSSWILRSSSSVAATPRRSAVGYGHPHARVESSWTTPTRVASARRRDSTGGPRTYPPPPPPPPELQFVVHTPLPPKRHARGPPLRSATHYGLSHITRPLTRLPWDAAIARSLAQPPQGRSRSHGHGPSATMDDGPETADPALAVVAALDEDPDLKKKRHAAVTPSPSRTFPFTPQPSFAFSDADSLMPTVGSGRLSAAAAAARPLGANITNPRERAREGGGCGGRGRGRGRVCKQASEKRECERAGGCLLPRERLP